MTYVSRRTNNTDRELLEAIAQDDGEKWGFHEAAYTFPVKHDCVDANKVVNLVITGTADWEMSSGVRCRSIAFRCSYCGSRVEFRRIKQNGFKDWTATLLLIDQQFVRALE